MRLKRGLYYSVINLEKSITGTDERTGKQCYREMVKMTAQQTGWKVET